MIVKLSNNNPSQPSAFGAIVRSRATCREFSGKPIRLAQLSQLLYVAQGNRAETSKRNAPSAQEQYPLNVYVCVNFVDGLEKGLYRYDGSDNTLEYLGTENLDKTLAEAAIGDQPWVSKAAAVLIVTGNIEGMNRHFAEQPPVNERGERYVYIETGAVAQNVHLQATELGLGMVLVGGFDNEKVKTLLSLPGDLEPAALLCVGNIS